MKICKSILAGAVLLATSAVVYAQDPAFTATGLSCDQVNWSQQSLRDYPRIANACQEVMQLDGKYFVRFDGEVRRVTDRGQQVTVDFRDGDLLTLTPPENLNLTINDEPTSPRDLRPGDQLRFYIPQDQLAAVFFAGQPDAAPAQTVPIAPAPVTQLAAAEPSPAPAETRAPDVLPATASRLPFLALVGMVFVLLGGALTFRRLARTST